MGGIGICALPFDLALAASRCALKALRLSVQLNCELGELPLVPLVLHDLRQPPAPLRMRAEVLRLGSHPRRIPM